MYTISGQVLSLFPLAGSHPDNATWAWDGQYISFYLKKTKSTGEETVRRQNLQISVSGRLIDFTIQDQALNISTMELPDGLEKTWSFHNTHLTSSWNSLWTTLLNDTTLHEKFPIFNAVSDGSFPYQTEPLGINYSAPIAQTVIADSIASRKTCRVCGKAVKDQDRQQHVGQHIIKAMYGVEDTSVKTPVRSCHLLFGVLSDSLKVSKSYPCGMCGGTCQASIKAKKLDSQCPSTYPFMISTAKKFLSTRPCTNVPVACAMLDCKEIHWKYNYRQHLAERHPGWEERLPQTFLPEIQVCREELLELKIPPETAVSWPPLQTSTPLTPLTPPTPPQAPSPRRSATSLPRLPSRCDIEDKENCDPSDGRATKKRRIN
ncbi:hypothetical protein R3P38DRAFT_3541400 [Favolaschia claudopus]|uniref:Uncharacterized protein n=1 Tax=Favolaschia claudopus TaxID=2862362 RepID=A0AAW0BA70_9AGAR